GSIDFARAGWAALAPMLAGAYRTIQIEHRGHGRTDNPAGTLSYPRIAADVAQFIERLGLAPAHVAGISDGAIAALALGMTRPELVASLVLVGANFFNDEQCLAASALFDPETIEREHPDFAAALAGYHDPHHHPGYWRELVGQIRDNIALAPAWTEADLARVAAPTLLIAGERDPWANLDQMLAMRRAIPDAEMLILNHAGMGAMDNHIVQHTRAGIVGPVVLDFLGRRRLGCVEGSPILDGNGRQPQ
ncbi:MAG TPA: alpha/beta hydrolase, partial [Thermomicrobiales bacterium]|nr:alpha/beta hydrolase [Thermomicrobiales bacterium]